MAVETNAQFITQLETSYPRKRDLIKEGDDHIRLIKRIVQNTFPNFDSFLTITSGKMNKFDSVFEFDTSTTTLKTGMSFKSSGNTIDFNPNSVTEKPNIVTGVPDPRQGKTGLYDAVNVNWLVESKFTGSQAWPIGSIHISVDPKNPSETLGFGEWVAFGAGRVLMGCGVGFDGNDTITYEKPMETGGKYYHVLTEKEIPKHDHSAKLDINIKEGGSHHHGFAGDDQLAWGASYYNDKTFGYDARSDNDRNARYYKTTTDGAHSHQLDYKFQINPVGGGEKHNNIQPYITVYMWRRTK